MTKSNSRGAPRISPPVLAISHIVLALFVGMFYPLPIPAPSLALWVGFGLAAGGFVLGILALMEFKRGRSRNNPKTKNHQLIKSGIYRFTRNPVYLGFVLITIGLPLSGGNYWGIILAWPLVVLMNNLVIKHEEYHLTKLFKTEYEEYASKVRRWI